MTALKAPFPWFGGKSRVAHLVWPALGDVSNYVEAGTFRGSKPEREFIERVSQTISDARKFSLSTAHWLAQAEVE